MTHARFINNTLDITHNCNICSEIIENGKIIQLKCNTKHIYCYDCICDWYKELKKKKYNNNYTIITMCPTCRKNGGLLPVYNNDKPLKDIHIMHTTSPVQVSLPVKKNKKDALKACGVKLKTKDGFCVSIGKTQYDGLCGIHFKCNKSVVPSSNNNSGALSNNISSGALSNDITSGALSNDISSGALSNDINQTTIFQLPKIDNSSDINSSKKVIIV